MSTKYSLILTILMVSCLVNVAVSSDRSDAIKAERLMYFHAGDQNLKRWFEMTIDHSIVPNSNREADLKLERESCNETVHSSLHIGSYSMCDAYYESQVVTDNCPSGMLTAECKAVYMYSTNFYSTYNTNIRNRIFEHYKLFTSVLYSALVKLSRSRPLPENVVLYRGMNQIYTIDVNRFHFNQFVSTSLRREVAEEFGNKTLLQFRTNNLKVGAKLRGLVKYESEEEVLLTPFEAFEVISQTMVNNCAIIILKSSPNQGLLDASTAPYIHDELYLPDH